MQFGQVDIRTGTVADEVGFGRAQSGKSPAGAVGVLVTDRRKTPGFVSVVAGKIRSRAPEAGTRNRDLYALAFRTGGKGRRYRLAEYNDRNLRRFQALREGIVFKHGGKVVGIQRFVIVFRALPCDRNAAVFGLPFQTDRKLCREALQQRDPGKLERCLYRCRIAQGFEFSDHGCRIRISRRRQKQAEQKCKKQGNRFSKTLGHVAPPFEQRVSAQLSEICNCNNNNKAVAQYQGAIRKMWPRSASVRSSTFFSSFLY